MRYFIVEILITQKEFDVSEAGVAKCVDKKIVTYHDILKTNQAPAINFIRDIILQKGVLFNDKEKQDCKKTEVKPGN